MGTTTAPLAEYQTRYGFAHLGGPPTPDAVAELRQKVRLDPFRARRAVAKERLRSMEFAVALQCDRITLPIRREYSHSPESYEVAHGLYIGGVEREVSSIEFPSPNRFVRRHLLYVAEFPAFALRQYRAARGFLPATQLYVVSRDVSLFTNRLFERADPLLVAHVNDETQYLLAAWGLEHELPKSLGGLLDDVK